MRGAPCPAGAASLRLQVSSATPQPAYILPACIRVRKTDATIDSKRLAPPLPVLAILGKYGPGLLPAAAGNSSAPFRDPVTKARTVRGEPRIAALTLGDHRWLATRGPHSSVDRPALTGSMDRRPEGGAARWAAVTRRLSC